MEKEQKSVLLILMLFLLLITGLLAYSLPGNLFSPQRDSITEVAVMKQSPGINDSRMFDYRSSVFTNFREDRDITVTLSPAEVIRMEPEASVSQDSFTWEGVYSRRSMTYAAGEKHTSLFFEATVEYDRPLEVSVSTAGGVPVASIKNNASVPIKNIFIIYTDGVQHTRYSAYISSIGALSADTIGLESTYYDSQKLQDIMAEEGVSEYAAGSVYNSRIYGYGLIDADPWSQGNRTRLVYQLPESTHSTIVDIEVEPQAAVTERFCWVVADGV